MRINKLGEAKPRTAVIFSLHFNIILIKNKSLQDVIDATTNLTYFGTLKIM